MRKILAGFCIVLVFAVACILSVLCTAGIVKLFAFCFGFAFSWKIVLGIWVALVLLKLMLTKK